MPDALLRPGTGMGNRPRAELTFAQPIAALASWGQALVDFIGAEHARPILGRRACEAAKAREPNNHRNYVPRHGGPAPRRSSRPSRTAFHRLERDRRLARPEVNRFQRISPLIDSPFDDKAPSIPVGFTSNKWGSLASSLRTEAGNEVRARTNELRWW